MRLVGRNHAPVEHHRAAVGKTCGKVQIVRYGQNGDAVRVQFLQDRSQLCLCVGVQALCRLVEQKNVSIPKQ